MIVQVFQIHIINDIFSKPRGHHDESELKTCLMHARHLFYIATCISEYTKVMHSLSCTFKT